MEEFYQVISILNNLIINATDSIASQGKIQVIQKNEDDKCIFTEEDNGYGINPEDIELIFEPSYSTKYDNYTGEFSTGIGLTHVKNIIEEYFEGKLFVESVKNEGTTFKIEIPIDKIILSTNEDVK